MKYQISLFVLILALSTAALAQQNGVSIYAGQETREIKSLSAEDIATLQSGGGWGMARSAELNGVPGPAHLLELKDQIPLSPDQIEAIERISAELTAKAIVAGERLIELEKQLGEKFRKNTITDAELLQILDQISNSRRDLRYIHLSAHLTTPPLLSEEQISRYNTLRGYGKDNPCTNVPEGHDAKMWMQNNGCG